MYEDSEILKENEYQANKIVARVMRITIVIFALVYVLNLVGLFRVEKGIMTAVFIIGSLLLFLPTIIVDVLKMNGSWVKYVNIFCAVSFVIATTITLTFHVVILYVYGLAIASLYFSKRLNIMATVFTVVGVSAGQIVAFYLEAVPDDNFHDINETILFGVLPRALVFIAVAAIFIMLTKRTTAMLGEMMGAEQQKAMLEQMQRMKGKSLDVSGKLLSMVDELSEISGIASSANLEIEAESGVVLRGSEDNTDRAKVITEKIENITNRLMGLNEMSRQMTELAQQVKDLTEKNQDYMIDATNSM